MIVVPVRINNSEPLDFILDTGASRTIIDRKLAGKLQLVKVGEQILSGVEGSSASSIFQTDSVSIAGLSMKGLRISSQRDSPAGTWGVLGEDILHEFDLLIDYNKQVIDFQIILQSPEGDLLSSGLSGDRLPVDLKGRFEGHATANRLVLPVTIPAVGEKPLQMLLDSGSNSLIVFNQAGKARLSLQQQAYHSDSPVGSSGTLSAGVMELPALSIGSRELFHVTVILPTRRIEVDVDGVIPASIFHSLFICHSGQFVILNPARRKAGILP